MKHILSVVTIGRFSMFCRNGHYFGIDIPSSDCLVAMPDGCDELCVERERIDLCADCRVAERAGQDNRPPCTASEACVDRGCDKAGHD